MINELHKAYQKDGDTGVLKALSKKDYGTMTLEEIAKVFGITRERVRQIESMAINKLSHPKFSLKLRRYLELQIVEDETKLEYGRER